MAKRKKTTSKKAVKRPKLRHHAVRVAKHEHTRLIVGALSVLAIAALAVGSAIYYRYNYEVLKNSQTNDHYAYKVWQAGEIIESKDIAFSFNGAASNKQTIPKFWELEKGTKFVVVNVSFKNRSSDNYQLSPITSMFLRDESGTDYPVTSAPSISEGLGGQVNPGQTVRGGVGFTVPDSMTNLKFFFRPYLQSSAPIWVEFSVQ